MTLRPVNAAEAERLDEVPQGQDMLWSGVQLRSPRHHKFFFALLQLMWDGQTERKQGEFDNSRERFRKWLTCQAGHSYHTRVPLSMISQELIDALKEVDPDVFFVFDGDDVVLMRAKSIAWDKMDQRKFKPFCDKIIALVPEVLGSAPEDVLRAAEEMVGFSYASLGEQYDNDKEQGGEAGDPAQRRRD